MILGFEKYRSQSELQIIVVEGLEDLNSFIQNPT